jgi:hypothetical protein
MDKKIDAVVYDEDPAAVYKEDELFLKVLRDADVTMYSYGIYVCIYIYMYIYIYIYIYMYIYI